MSAATNDNLLEVCKACLHQLSTDADLDAVTAPHKYHSLVEMLREAIFDADPTFPPVANFEKGETR